MSDFGKRLADRYEDESQLACESDDELGAKVLSSAENLVRALTDESVSFLPEDEAVNLIETAIVRQQKWSPDEVRPKWGLALNILNDEKVNLRFKR